MYLTRHELYEGIWNSSARNFAMENGLSYQKIFYACKRYQVPNPDQQYVANLKHHPERLIGYERPPLLGDPDEMIYIPGLSDMNDLEELVGAAQAEMVNDAVDSKLEEEDAAPGRSIRELLDPALLEEAQEEERKDQELLPVFAEDIRKSVLKDQQETEKKKKKSSSKASSPKHLSGAPGRRTVPKTMTQEFAGSKISEQALKEIKNSPRWSLLYFLPAEERAKVVLQCENMPYPEVRKRLHKTAAKFLQTAQQYEFADLNSLPGPYRNISEDSVERVARLMSSIFRAVEKLGGKATSDYAVRVSGEKIPVIFSEGRARSAHEPTQEEQNRLAEYEALSPQEKKKHSKPRIPKWDTVYTGKLSITVAGLYVIKDHKAEPVEEHLGDVLELLYTTAYQLHSGPDEEMSEPKRQPPEQYLLEQERLSVLLQQAEEYDRAEKIRALIRAVHESLKAGELETPERWPEWATWASSKADWLDPTIGKKDDVLGVRHSPILEWENRKVLEEVTKSPQK